MTTAAAVPFLHTFTFAFYLANGECEFKKFEIVDHDAKADNLSAAKAMARFYELTAFNPGEVACVDFYR